MRFLPIFACSAPLFLQALARPYQSQDGLASKITARQEEEDTSVSMDEACGIGFCSIMGATIGGWGGKYTNVTTLDEFTAAVSASGSGVVVVHGNITGNTRVTVGSTKTILGWPGSSLAGIALHLNASRNVIIRNLRLTSIPSSFTSGISVQGARSIWLDHCEISSSSSSSSSTSTSSLISITHGSDYVTVTDNIFHSFSSGEAITIGTLNATSDSTGDVGKLHVTLAGNYIHNVKSAISFRFGTGHILNSIISSASEGINTLLGADLLIESSIFENVPRAIFSSAATETEKGRATIQSVLVGEGTSDAPPGNMTVDSLPYPYEWYVWDFYKVRENMARVGPTLHFREGWVGDGGEE